MPATLLEIWFESATLYNAGFEGRDEIEDPIDEALSASGLGEVTGGGSGDEGTNIDVSVESETNIVEAVALLKRVLKELKVPPETTITQYTDKEGDKIFRVYD
jgi:hypothetical protein